MTKPVSEITTEELLAERAKLAERPVSEMTTEELLAEREQLTGTNPILEYAKGLASGTVQAMTELPAAIGRVAARPARAFGVPVSADPVRAVMERQGLGLPQTTEAGRAGERTGQYVGHAVVPIAGAAAIPSTVVKTALPKVTGEVLKRPVLRGGAREVPMRPLVKAEALSAAGGAVGEEVGREVAGDVGGAVGGLVGSAGSPAAASGIRGAARGSTPHALRRTMEEAAQVGVELTPSQALPGAAQRNIAGAAETTFGTIPGGRQVADIRGMEQQRQMGQALEDVAQFPETRESAGILIQQGLRNFRDRFTQRKDVMYDKVADMVDPTLQIPLTQTRKTMRRLTESKAKIQTLLSALRNERIQRIAKEIGGLDSLTFEELRTVQDAVGDLLANPSLVDDLPRGETKRLFAALASDLEAGISGPALRQLKNANRFYKANMERFETFLNPAVRTAEPSKVLDAIITGGKTGSKRIRSIRDGMEPAQWRRVQAAVLRDIGRQIGSGMGDYSHERFLTNFRNMNQRAPEAMDALFGKYGQFRKDIERLVTVAERMREGSRVLYNPSGTGARQTAAATGGGAIMAGLMGRPDLLASLVGTAAVSGLLEYAFTRPAVTRWLARTTTIPAAQLPGHITRLENILQREAERDDPIGVGRRMLIEEPSGAEQ